MRIKALLRRTRPMASTPKLLQAGSIAIDFERKVACVGGEDIHLSRKEFGILSMLVAQPGRVFSREEILSEVWQGESYVLDRTIDVHITRIRRKLGEDGIRLTNRQGYGYCFE